VSGAPLSFRESVAPRLGRIVVSPYFALAHRLRWAGAQNVPRTGPVILAANHQSYFDPVMLSLAAERRIRFIGARRFFRMPVLGPLIRFFGAVPVEQEEPGHRSLGRLLDALDAGEPCGIFPEGGRTSDGGLCRPYDGVGMLALRSGAPVVPITIAGAYRVWPLGRPLPRPGRMSLVIGEPVRFGGRSTRARRREVTHEIMLRIADGFRLSCGPRRARQERRRIERLHPL